MKALSVVLRDCISASLEVEEMNRQHNTFTCPFLLHLPAIDLCLVAKIELDLACFFSLLNPD